MLLPLLMDNLMGAQPINPDIGGPLAASSLFEPPDAASVPVATSTSAFAPQAEAASVPVQVTATTLVIE